MAKGYTVKLNSSEKIEQLLQEIYDQSVKHIKEVQCHMSTLETSCEDLKDATIDEKIKYSKAMHDFIGDKDKALSRKLDVAKFLWEVKKNDGDVNKTLGDPEISKKTSLDLKSIRKVLDDNTSSETIDLKRK